MVFSTIGVGYFIYGKKQAETSFMLAGGILCFYPYVMTGAVSMFLVGVALAAAPFIAQRFDW